MHRVMPARETDMGLGSVFARPLAWGVVIAVLLAINPVRFFSGPPEATRFEVLTPKAPSSPQIRPASPTQIPQPTVKPPVVPAPVITPARKPEQNAVLSEDGPEQLEQPEIVQQTQATKAMSSPESIPASKVEAEPTPIVTLAPQTERQSPPKIDIDTADDLPSALKQATQLARYHLPRFMNAALSVPDSWTTSGVLIRIVDDNVSEDLWVENFVVDDTLGFVGTLTNAATKVPNRPAGAKMIFSVDQIQDWGFVSGGKGYGYFTAHAELPFLTAESRAGLLVFLAKEPLPPGWDDD